MSRYAIVQSGKIVGCVNWDGVSDHPYGDVDLRGPVPENATLEQLMGKAWGEIENTIKDYWVRFDPATRRWEDVPTEGEPYTPPQSAAEAIADEIADGSGDPEGIARMNHPHLFKNEPQPLLERPLAEQEAIYNAMGYGYAPLDHDGDGHPGGSLPAEPVNPPMTAEQLIVAANAKPTMPWFTFKAEAKRILGDDMPQKKPAIIAALKAKRNPK